MKSSWLRFAMTSLLMLAVSAGSACGDAPKKEEKKDDKKKKAAAATSKGKEERVFVPVAKPEWDAILPHFTAHVQGLRSDLGGHMGASNIRDVFLDLAPKGTEEVGPQNMKGPKQGVKAVVQGPKKKGDGKEKAQKDIDSILKAINSPVAKSGAGAGKAVELGPKDPLTAFPLNRYIVRIVMTGVANPEAFIEGPDGKMHVLHRGDRLGSEGGMLVDLLKSKVLFRVPDREELVEVVMAPEITPTLLEGDNLKAVSGGGTKKSP